MGENRSTIRGYRLAVCLFAVVVCLCAGSVEATTITIATFADPAVGSDEPLFTVDYLANTVSGSWPSAAGGLTLNVVAESQPYPDAFFVMAPVKYTDGAQVATTDPGLIEFYEAGAVPGTDLPLIEISFTSATLTPLGMGSSDFSLAADGVTITGSALTDTYIDESFGFAFANQQYIDGDSQKGYTASASFTSSGAIVPEPALTALAILSIGAYRIRKRRVLR